VKSHSDARLKTARFTVVVAKCGRPSVHLTLLTPAKDQALRRLDGQGRVMTILPAHRVGTDHGLVGIHPAPGMQLLVFPRSVRRFAGKRIVGINYELLDQDLHLTGRAAVARPPTKAGGRARSTVTPVTLFPSPAPASAPAANPQKEKERPPPEPPTLPVVLRRLRAIERLLDQKRAAAAREETGRLIDDLARGLKPPKRRSSQ
jgi:hypothetical protein